MTEYFIPAPISIKLKSGLTYKRARGLHEVPDELANHSSANDLGIKPMEEVTDAEWRSIGMKKPVRKPVQTAHVVIAPVPSPVQATASTGAAKAS